MLEYYQNILAANASYENKREKKNMACFYDILYYENNTINKLCTPTRTQPTRACNNRTYIYFNRDKKTIHDNPQHETRHETRTQNMFGFIGNQKVFIEANSQSKLLYSAIYHIRTRN